MDILALVLITILVPTMVLVGIKLYHYNNYEKLIRIFAILLFAFDLFRFFYNARFFVKATTPASELKFSYLAVYAIFMLFATYNKGKFGDFMRKGVVLSCLMPLVIGIFNQNVFTSANDSYSLLKALYYIESGLSVLLAILIYKQYDLKFCNLDMLYFCVFPVGYALINMCSILCWQTNYDINLLWFVQMAVCLASVFVVFGTIKLCKFIKSKKVNQ